MASINQEALQGICDLTKNPSIGVTMLYDIVEVKVVKDHILDIRFENGISGEVDISKIIPFKGVFTQLKDASYFSTVRVDNELGTIVWDSGADLAPDYLYSIISNKVA